MYLISLFQVFCLLLMVIPLLRLTTGHPPQTHQKRDLLIQGLFSDGEEDLEPVTSNPSASSSSSSTSKNSTHKSYQPKYLPFRVKIFNESESIELDNAYNLPEDFYLHDPLLDFDSPLLVEHCFECTVKYQHYSRFHTAKSASNAYDEIDLESITTSSNYSTKSTPLQVEISGQQCDLVNLVLLQLKWKSNITHLIVRRTALRQIDRFYFGDAKLFELQRIDLIDNHNLSSIDQRAFDGLSQLELLRVFHCSGLSQLHRLALVGVKSLRQFIWARNSALHSDLFVNITRAASRHIVPSLVHLHIESSSSTSFTSPDLKLTKDDLIQLRQLQTFHLIRCNLAFIHPMTFAFLANLESLSLAHNPRLSLDNLVMIFSTLSKISKSLKLTHVNLSGSLSTRTVPKLLLFPIGKLQISHLQLQSISLKSISQGDLPPMPNIEHLYLDGNPIESIEDHSLDALENLQLLSLRGNSLQVIRSELFYNLPKLVHLDLSGEPTNPTHLEIDPKAFVGLNIRILNLSHRLLDPLPDKVFLGLHKTEELYLRACDLRQIEYLTFFFLKSLRLIDLSDNPRLIETLRETHDDSFFGLESIETIRMANCNVNNSDLDSVNGIFTRMHENVQELDLSGNLLTELNIDQFAQFGELKSLNLSHNLIRPWMNESVFRMNAELVQLDLSDNQLELISSIMMDDLYRMHNLSFGFNALRCDCSLELFNSEWLQTTIDKPISYMDTHNPLHSSTKYFCIDPTNSSNRVNLHQFSDHCAQQLITSNSWHSTSANPHLVILFIISIFLISLAVLGVTFVYYSELNQIFSNYFLKSNVLDGHDDSAVSYEYDAFVSYNVSDSEWIFAHLVPNIEQPSNANQRIRLCVYDRDFIAGRPISECILESIRQSRRVILVVSNAFIKSPWCRYETDLAHHHNTLLNRTGGVDGLILIKLEPLEPDLPIPIQLEFLLKTRIYLEWDSAAGKVEQTEFWHKMKQALGIANVVEPKVYEKETKLKLLRDKLLEIVDDLVKRSIKVKDEDDKEKQNNNNKHKYKTNENAKIIVASSKRKKFKLQDAISDAESNDKVECTKYVTCTSPPTVPVHQSNHLNLQTYHKHKVKQNHCNAIAVTTTNECCDDFEINVRL